MSETRQETELELGSVTDAISNACAEENYSEKTVIRLHARESDSRGLTLKSPKILTRQWGAVIKKCSALTNWRSKVRD